jgi:acyl carrier protein
MHMEINQFLEKFAEQFDESDNSKFTPDAEFRNIEGWDSMTALSVIAMVDTEYNVTVTGDDIKKSNTIKELYEIVSNKQK